MKSDFLKPINSLLYWNQASSFLLPNAAVLGGKIPSSQSQDCISGVQDSCRISLVDTFCLVFCVRQHLLEMQEIQRMY